MARILILVCPALVAAVLFFPDAARGGQGLLYVHFFTSAICPHCKQAESQLPGMLKRLPRLRLMTYQVLNARGQADAVNIRNKKKLIGMINGINTRLGGKPFIYEQKTPHSYSLVNGVPYYLKKISESTTVKKEVTIPVFILGNRVYVGYQQDLLLEALEEYNAGTVQ